MTRLIGFICSTAFLLLLSYLPLQAQTKIEFQTAEGFTDNLFLDTNSTGDNYNTTKVDISTYPVKFMELKLANEYTYYGDTYNLSNFKGDVGVTLLPLNENSAFSLYINGNYSTRVYRVAYQHFSTDNYDLAAGLGYSISEVFQLRTGWNYNSAEYTNELPKKVDTTDIVISPFPPYDTTVYTNVSFGMEADNDNHEFYIGGNFTFPGSNTVDLEAGYARKNMAFVERPENRDYLRAGRDSLVDGKLESFYFSPRFSRPIGDKFGLNITYIYRNFKDPDNIVVPGISTEFLSPWASVYEGEAITATIKTFLIPNFIVIVGAGYWDKDFLTTEQKIDDNNTATPEIQIRDRRDYQSKIYLSIQKPFPLRRGTLIEPALQFDYSDNKSSNSLYDYSSFSALLAVKIHF